MSSFRCLFVIFFILSLSACSALDSRDSEPLVIDVVVSEPARMRFQGKGASAGAMLMSAMGPVGIGIGVAIDEGIAKEIDRAAQQS